MTEHPQVDIQRLSGLIAGFKNKRILLIGDLVADHVVGVVEDEERLRASQGAQGGDPPGGPREGDRAARRRRRPVRPGADRGGGPRPPRPERVVVID